ncbi:MAG: hypothetical protein JWN86_1816 [Planctomycetota bacterium]|nr:hypothetical protein [Planctomycetota bacterium]
MSIGIHEPPPIRRISTRRRSHLPFDTSDPVAGGTYSAYTWDHEAGDWEAYRLNIGLMALRAVIRELEPYWDTCSYLIERD